MRPDTRAGSRPGGVQRRPAPASFVILLWLEPQQGGAEPAWRWRVKQGQTGEEACFRRLGDVLAYVSSRTGVPAPR